jgi:uncharacterized membrane protein HdeD (DUF308 family)
VEAVGQVQLQARLARRGFERRMQVDGAGRPRPRPFAFALVAMPAPEADDGGMTVQTRADVPALNDVRALARRTWWVFLVSGLASLSFGLLAFARPGIGLFVLATFFAVDILVDGVSSVVGALQHREKDGWWLLLLLGVLGALVGAYVLMNPPLSLIVFVYTIAFQALMAGVLLVTLGWKIRQRTTKEWMLYVTGTLSILFGLSIFVTPLATSLSIVFVVALWSIVTGVLRIAFALRVRNLPAPSAA